MLGGLHGSLRDLLLTRESVLRAGTLGESLLSGRKVCGVFVALLLCDTVGGRGRAASGFGLPG